MNATRLPFRHRLWRWFYDRVAFAYDAVLTLGQRLGMGSEEQVRRRLLAQFPLQPGATVVDVGCGTGALQLHLAPDAFYLGVDASLHMLRRARRKRTGSAAYLLADATALPLSADCATLALAMGVLQHVQAPAQAVRELGRIAPAVAIADEPHALPRIRAAAPGSATVEIAQKDYFVLFLQNKPF